MRSYLVALALLTASGVAVASPTRDDALSAIATLEKDVLSHAAIDAARTITQFAEESEEVVFTLSPEIMPWMREERAPNDLDEAVDSMLLAVYFAGNAKSQLMAKKAEDDPYSGWIAVIRAYRQIQAKRPVVIPSLEKLSAMEVEGTLKAYAREMKAKQRKQKQPPEPAPTSRSDSY